MGPAHCRAATPNGLTPFAGFRSEAEGSPPHPRRLGMDLDVLIFELSEFVFGKNIDMDICIRIYF
jgi:hypothetical protein